MWASAHPTLLNWLFNERRFLMNFTVKSKVITVLLCTIVAACNLPEPAKKPVELHGITAPLAEVQIKPKANMNAFRRKKDGSLRTYTKGLRTFETVNGETVEVVGASCKLNTAEFQINVVTPVRVAFPIMNKNASPYMSILCVKNNKSHSSSAPLQFQDAASGGNALAKGLAKGLDRHVYVNFYSGYNFSLHLVE